MPVSKKPRKKLRQSDKGKIGRPGLSILPDLPQMEWLHTDDVGALVADMIRFNDDRADAAAALFGLLLDEARMGLENDSPFGKEFLENAHKAVEAKVAAGACEPVQRMKIAGLYRRAGLPVPDVLMLGPDDGGKSDELSPPDLEPPLLP